MVFGFWVESLLYAECIHRRRHLGDGGHRHLFDADGDVTLTAHQRDGADHERWIMPVRVPMARLRCVLHVRARKRRMMSTRTDQSGGVISTELAHRGSASTKVIPWRRLQEAMLFGWRGLWPNDAAEPTPWSRSKKGNGRTPSPSDGRSAPAAGRVLPWLGIVPSSPNGETERISFGGRVSSRGLPSIEGQLTRCPELPAFCRRG